METDRIIIAVGGVNGNPDIAFPKVCGWLREDGVFSTSNLWESFPDNAEVFMHIDRSRGRLPDRGAYGVYSCEDMHTNKAAHWGVTNAGNDLCEVLILPAHITSIRNLSDWIESRFTGKLQNIFLGSNEVYLFGNDLGLVGPVILDSPSGCFKPLPTVKLFRDAQRNILSLPKGPSFVLKTHLPTGDTVQITKRDAAKTLIHRLWKRGTVKWLTRDNSRDLAEALLAFNELQGVDWVKDDLKAALENLDAMGDIKEEACQLLLQNPGVKEAIEAKWREENTTSLNTAKSALDGASTKYQALKAETEAQTAMLESLKAQLLEKEGRLNQLEADIEQGRKKAVEAFHEELQKLSENPAHLAVLNSLLGPKGALPNNSPLLSTRRVATPIPSNSVREALQTNFHDIGLTIGSAKDLSFVIAAASMTGQAVSFIGNNSDYLVDGAAVALSGTQYSILDTPAGLLQPYQWPEEILKPGSVCVIRSINRSAIDIVLGNLKESLLAQANGIKGLGLSLIFTVQPFDRFSVPQLPFVGPLIDERFLEFRSSSPSIPCAYAPFNPVEFKAVEREEVLNTFKNIVEISKDLIKGASLKYHCGVLGALIALGLSESDAERTLFKYWLLPRLDESEIQIWLEPCDTWIRPDPNLTAYYGKYASISDTPEE